MSNWFNKQSVSIKLITVGLATVAVGLFWIIVWVVLTASPVERTPTANAKQAAEETPAEEAKQGQLAKRLRNDLDYRCDKETLRDLIFQGGSLARPRIPGVADPEVEWQLGGIVGGNWTRVTFDSFGPNHSLEDLIADAKVECRHLLPSHGTAVWEAACHLLDKLHSTNDFEETRVGYQWRGIVHQVDPKTLQQLSIELVFSPAEGESRRLKRFSMAHKPIYRLSDEQIIAAATMTIGEWAEITDGSNVEFLRYFASSLHPNDSENGNGTRVLAYLTVVQNASKKRELRRLLLKEICPVGDKLAEDAFALDYVRQ